jgi:hypothetical protein
MDQSSTAAVGSQVSGTGVEPAPSTTEGSGQSTGGPAVRGGRQAPPAETTGTTGGTAAQDPAAQQPGETVEHWRQRYTGLQGVYRQEAAQAQARIAAAEAARVSAEQRAQRAEESAWVHAWQNQGFSPEQIAAGRRDIRARQGLEAERARLAADRQALRNQQTAFRQATDGPARRIVAQQISDEFHVPVDRILNLSSPEAMREVAAAIRETTRSTRLATRAASRADAAESGGGSGVDLSKMSAHEKIKFGIRQARSAGR